MEVVASELFSARVAVSPKPAESDPSNVPTDPSRGRYKAAADFGAPYGERLCKLVRKHLLGSIIAKYAKVKPKVDSNLAGPGKPTKKELERWKIRRAKKLQRRRSRKRVVSTKKKRLSASKRCVHCGDVHFRRSCGVRDARMNLMVRQICQKTEVIAENLCDVKSKLEGLESAYHDMMLRVQRLQSNRVCLGLLTGCDYPGERHPHNCPCADQRIKEEKDRKKREDRRLEEEAKKKEEAERREKERVRRETMLESRKKRFYSRLKQQQQKKGGVGDPLDQYGATVRFQGSMSSAEESEPEDVIAVSQLESAKTDSPLKSIAQDRKKKPDDEGQGSVFKKFGGPNDLTRLEGTRRKTKLSLMDEDDGVGRKPSKPSLLTRALDKSRRTSLAAPHDLIIMDGGIKTVTDVIVDDGGMIRHELVIEEYKFDEDADTSDDVDQLTDIEEQLETDSIPIKEEEEEDIPEDTDESERSSEKEEKPTMPFGDFLDLMEVF